MGGQRLPPTPDSPATQGRGGLGGTVSIGQGIGDASASAGGGRLEMGICPGKADPAANLLTTAAGRVGFHGRESHDLTTHRSPET